MADQKKLILQQNSSHTKSGVTLHEPKRYWRDRDNTVSKFQIKR